MSSRAKLVSIVLVFGIVGQAFGISTPATASDQSSLQAATQPRPAAISPLASPLAAPALSDMTVLSDETASVVSGTDVQLADQRVQLHLPPAVPLTRVRVQVRTLKHLQASERGLAFVFDISATDAAGQAATHFAEPVTITLRLADLLGSLDNAYVAYFNEQTAAWESVPITAQDAQAGTVTFRTDHFSTYGGGVVTGLSRLTSPAAWTLKFNDAQVSTFDGSLNWAYDLALPAGPGGIQPSLALNYNSRRVDSLLDWPNPIKPGPTDQSPELGYGWELDAGEIAWAGVGGWIDPANGNVSRMTWRPSWVLRLNGQSLRVVPSSGMISTINGYSNEEWKKWQYRSGGTQTPHYCGWADGAYRVEDRPDLRVRWECGAEDGQWQVTLPDGTVYRYGATADSRQRLYAIMTEYGDNGWVAEQRTVRWRLNAVDFPNGVSTVYTYTTDTARANCCGAQSPYEFQTYLSEVSYPGTRVVLNWTAGKTPLQNLELYRLQGDGATWARTQRLNFAYTTLPSTPQDGGDPRRVLTAIQPSAPNGTAEVTLPATTFGYTMLPNKGIYCETGYEHCGDGEVVRGYYYPRLTAIDNGYGGRIRAAYGTLDEGFWHNLNYHLTWREVTDGLSPAAGVRYDYTYSDQRRYLGRKDPYSPTGIDQTAFTKVAGQSNNEWPDGCGGCAGSKTGGNFVGYLTSTVSASTLPGGVLLSRTEDQFAIDHKAVFGRLLTETVRDASLSIVQQTAHAWAYTASVLAFSSWRADGVVEPQHYLSATVWLARQTLTRGGRTARTEYGYDPYGNVTSTIERGFTDVSGDEWSTYRAYAYNANAWVLDKPISETVYQGVRGESATNPVLYTQQNFYYDNSNVLGALPTRGLLTRLDQGAGNVWATQRTGYDAWANPVVITDARGFTSTARYDGLTHSFLLTTTNAQGQATGYEYYGVNAQSADGAGPVGTLKVLRDANGAATRYAYDAFGRLVSLVKPGDTFNLPSTKYVYGDIGTGVFTLTAPLKIETQQREGGCESCVQVAQVYYDGLGQAIQQRGESASSAQQVVMDTVYDGLGRVAMTYVPTFTTSSTTFARPSGWNSRPKAQTQYDALSRPVAVTNADGTVTRMGYLGTTTVITDANGHRQDSVVDAYGRLQAVAEYSGTTAYTSTYQYDILGNLRGVTDALNNTTVITYDALSRKVGMRDPDMGAWTYGYDANSNLITQTDALGQTAWFGYDKLNRLVEKRQGSSTGTVLVQYEYDQGTNGIGHRTAMTNANAMTRWTYDVRGRVGIETKALTGITGTFSSLWQYDDLDRVTQTRLPNGEYVSTAYNAAGQPTGLNAGSQTLVSGATYNALGSPQMIASGNGVQTRYLYFGLDVQAGNPQFFGKLRQVCVTTSNCALGAYTGTLMNLAYWYDNVGNITTLRDDTNRQKENFAYDPLDRLVSATPEDIGVTTLNYTQTYRYNAIGNFITKAGVSQVYSATQPHAVRSLSDGSSFQYDANGNMTRRTEMSGTQLVTYQQQWDSDNRLVVVTNTNTGQVMQYFYDADGQRVKRISPQGTTFYVNADYEVTGPSQMVTPTYAHKLYFPVMVCASNDGSGIPSLGIPLLNLAAARVTYRFNGQQVAVREGVTLTFIYGDHLGSASVTANISGTKVSEVRYYPFGEMRYSSGTTLTTKRFNAKELQTDIGLYDYGARFLDPTIGRFVSADSVVPKPGDPQNLNRYTHTRNNPLIYIDPSGHLACPTTSDACKSAAGSLRGYAETLKQLVSAGKMKPVEAFASLSDKALGLYENDINGYMWGMTNVIIGIDPNEVPLWQAGFFQPDSASSPGRYPDANPAKNSAYMGQQWLAYNQEPNSHTSDQGDWLGDYFDGTSNQAYHFWFLASMTYYYSPIIATAANVYHDPYILDNPSQYGSWFIIGPAWFQHTGEASQQDYQLGVAAIQFAMDVAPATTTTWTAMCSPASCSMPTTVNPSSWIRSNLETH